MGSNKTWMWVVAIVVVLIAGTFLFRGSNRTVTDNTNGSATSTPEATATSTEDSRAGSVQTTGTASGSKSASSGSYIQLNNATIVVVPQPTTAPTTVGIVHNVNLPCYSGSEQVACPLGVKLFSSDSRIGTRAIQYEKDVELYPGLPEKALTKYPTDRKYIVRITASTQVLNRNRAALALSDIRYDDRVNVYGLLKADGSIDAVVIRDLSTPRIVGSVNFDGVSGPATLATGVQATWVIDADVPGTETVTYTANWGDGSPVASINTPVLTHIYSKPGVYVITFTIKTSGGKTASQMKTVNVVNSQVQ